MDCIIPIPLLVLSGEKEVGPKAQDLEVLLHGEAALCEEAAAAALLRLGGGVFAAGQQQGRQRLPCISDGQDA